MALEEQKAAVVAATMEVEAQVKAAQDVIAETLRTLAARGVAATIAAQSIEIPKPRDVLFYGADPTGVRVANDAFKKALAAGDGRVPAGTYLIDAVTNQIILSTGQSLIMDPEAILVIKPNAEPRYYALQAKGDDILIQGGRIIGDRLKHTYVDTGDAKRTHEWGYGVSMSGERNQLIGTYIAQCTGDGIAASGADLVIRNVVATQCRRQGMSVFTASNLRVYDSEFSMTGAYLTDAAAPNGPCAGVDVEPDRMSTVDVYFERCKFNGNRAGFLAWLRSEVGGLLTCNMVNCEFVGNSNGAQGKALAGKVVLNITASTFTNNKAVGVRSELNSVFNVAGNVFDRSGDRTDADITGLTTATKYDIQVLTGGVVNAGTNKYV